MNAIKKECYALIQQVVKARDVFCRGPGCPAITTSGHHIYSRSDVGTAFNPRYTVSLCVDCHAWAHGEPIAFQNWVISWMGEDEYYAALRLSNAVVKHQDFNQIREFLKQELAKYKLLK